MKTKTVPSMFNYFCYDDAGNMILHNTLEGYFCRISKKISGDAVEYLTGKCEIPDNIHPELKKYFVDSSDDELEKYKNKLNVYYDSPVLELSILPTHQCNCRCVYCYEDFDSGVMSDSIQEALLKFVEDKLQTCSALHVGWFGGEPLVGMSVIRNLSPKLMDICNKMNKTYSSSITTNGTLLTYDIFCELQKYRVISYQITIDGTKDVHDIQRPLVGTGSAYDMIMNNLKEIKEKKRGNTFTITIRINLTHNSAEKLPEFLLELEKNFGGDYRFVFNPNVAQDWGGERIEQHKDDLINSKDDLDVITDSIIRFYDENKLTLRVPLGSRPHKYALTLITGCYVNKKNFITIDSTGAIYKCAQQVRQDFIPLAHLADYKGLDDLKEEQEKWDSVIFPEIPEKCKGCVFIPQGCWGVDRCPLTKFRKKYFNKNTADDSHLQDGNESNDQNIKKEPDCQRFKDSVDDVLRSVIKEKEYPFIEELFVKGENDL